MTKPSSKSKITKYRTLFLPKEMVDLLIITSHISPLDIEQSEITVGLSIFNDIMSKSDMYNRYSDKEYHTLPMYSKYLQTKYGNNYRNYTSWLTNNSIIWNNNNYYEDNCYKYSLHNIKLYKYLSYNKLSISNNKLRDVLYTYCLQSNTTITLITYDSKEIQKISKNRIFVKWYKIRIPINKQNKRYLTKEYEEDSTTINNASPYLKQMGSYYRNNLKIDYQEAINHTVNKYNTELEIAKDETEINKAYKRYTSRIMSINDINGGRLNKSLRFKRNPTNNRLDTNLTNMASDLRPFIVGYDKMAYLDLSNSQPVLLNIILDSHRENATEVVKMELDRYLHTTISGHWYEELIRVYNIKHSVEGEMTFKEARDLTKKVWMLIAYSKNNQLKWLKDDFAKEYPYIASVIKEIKSKDYKQFSIKLQKIESYLFIDKISSELVKNGIIPYTIHDGVLVPLEHKEKTHEIMKAILTSEIGCTPTIKIE